MSGQRQSPKRFRDTRGPIGSYEATVLQAADRTNELRASMAGYALEVSGGP